VQSSLNRINFWTIRTSSNHWKTNLQSGSF